MSKTVTIPSLPAYVGRAGTEYRIDATAFARFIADPDCQLSRVPAAWIYAGLVSYVFGPDEYVLTPRGQDLLASIGSIPDDPVPEQPKVTPCKSCGGTGERPLFVSMETCDACGGSGVLPIIHVKTRFEFVGNTGHIAFLGSDEWRTEGLPDVGRHVEVTVRSGELLRGLVTETDPAWKNGLTIYGRESRPLAERSRWAHTWTTWTSSHADTYVRVGWRYVDAPKLDAPDDSR